MEKHQPTERERVYEADELKGPHGKIVDFPDENHAVVRVDTNQLLDVTVTTSNYVFYNYLGNNSGYLEGQTTVEELREEFMKRKTENSIPLNGIRLQTDLEPADINSGTYEGKWGLLILGVSQVEVS